MGAEDRRGRSLIHGNAGRVLGTWLQADRIIESHLEGVNEECQDDV